MEQNTLMRGFIHVGCHGMDESKKKAKRKQWLPENMEEACKSVKSESMSLREAARAYNIPVETLRRRVVGIVSLDCRSSNSSNK